jgi:hypothetical protein
MQAGWNKPSLPSNIISKILFAIGVAITSFGLLFPPLFFVGAGLIIVAGVCEANRRFQTRQLKNKIVPIPTDASTKNDENSTSEQGYIIGETVDDESLSKGGPRGHTQV